MARGSGNARADSRFSLQRDKKYSSIEEEKALSFIEETKITITVKSIENIDENNVKEIIVKMDFLGATLNQTLQIPIENNRADIDFSGFIQIESGNPSQMDDILSNPVLFTIMDCSASSGISPPMRTPSPIGEVKKKTSKNSNSPGSNSKTVLPTSNVLGVCNLDIGKLVCEKKTIKETLLIEANKNLLPTEITSWTKLPKLMVVASAGAEPLISESAGRFNNIIGITIESVYNLPEHIVEGSVFDAYIQVPSIDEKTRKIKFSNGLVTAMKDIFCRKKWLTMNHMEGHGVRAKQSISPEVSDVINTVSEAIDLEKETKKPKKIIQWNMWKNSLMLKNDVSYLYSKITKHQVWPIEIKLPTKNKELQLKEKSAKSDKKSKPPPSNTAITNPEHYTAFINLTPLLCPGVTKIRVAAQLLTYSETDLISKLGDDFLSIHAETSSGNIKAKAGSVKSRISVLDHEEKDSPGVPVFDEKGCPTFIIIEVELLKPFCQKRDIEKLQIELKSLLSVKGKMKQRISNLTIMEEGFTEAIKDSVQILTHEYQDFIAAFKKSGEDQPEDLDYAFEKYLIDRKNFYKIKTTLGNKIIGLVNEKYGAIEQYKEKIPEIYVYLVNEMHKTTNKCQIGQENVSKNHYNDEVLQLYAEEALEEGDKNLAERYLLQKLSRDTLDPDYWLDAAVFYTSLYEYEKAIEAVKQALCLNFNHQVGLLMYALLMAIAKNGTVAEMTFEILLTKYPSFIEGWMAFRLFYLTFNNSGGALIALREAKKVEFEAQEPIEIKSQKLTDDSDQDFSCQKFSEKQNLLPKFYGVASLKHGIDASEPLSWTISFCPMKNRNIKTAIFLQKLGFHQFSLMSLSQELVFSECLADKDFIPSYYVYYTSVNHYLQGRYMEAIPLLQKIVKEYGKDCFLWSLLGHCYYKLENHSRAIGCYEYVLESYSRPDDIHLIYLRMGYYYIQANKFPCAKRVLLLACKYSPTPKAWKGVGIACLRMKEAHDADLAFSEANFLDNKDPETWAYLALTNAMLRRLDLFKQCYLEAIKRGLRNSDIIAECRDCEEANGLKCVQAYKSLFYG